MKDSKVIEILEDIDKQLFDSRNEKDISIVRIFIRGIITAIKAVDSKDEYPTYIPTEKEWKSKLDEPEPLIGNQIHNCKECNENYTKP